MTEAFRRDDDDYHAALQRRVLTLTGDELQKIHDLFDWRNKDLPWAYWMTGARVRILIRKEQGRRKEAAPDV